ncbi:hypothetical protein D3C72_1860660 [compost metagenome]
MSVIGFATQFFGRLAPDAQAGINQHAGEYHLQRCIRQAVRQHQPERRCCHTNQRNEQRSPITHQPLAQAQHRTNRCSQTYSQQAHRCRFDHR